MTNDKPPAAIIAGAGPVGLALACELGQRGVECLLIEKRNGTITVPKQSMVSSRNMEFCRRWGVARKVREAVWPDSHPRDFVYLDSMRGRELLRVKVPSFAEQQMLDFTPEPPCPCPQIYFDPILLARTRSFPSVTIAYNTRVDSFVQDEQGVGVTATDLENGEARSLRTQFLIGCEGPAGTIRQGLGIALDGLGVVAHSLNLFFRSAELASVHDKGWARFYRIVDETGCWAELIPIDGRELWRLTVFDEPASKQDPAFLLRRMAGGPFAYEMLSVDPWERRDFVARRYGHGRVVIAGDAAHECSPTGGIGMHTGLEEAVNLGWKLAAVIEGWGGDALLPSYEAERRPVAARNVELATRSYCAIAGIPGLSGGASSQGPASWQLSPPRWLSVPEHLKLQYCYEASPICIADGMPPPEAEPERYVASTRPGSRAPHAWLADSRSTLDLFGDGFVLLRLGDDAPQASELIEAAQSRRVPLRVVHIAEPAIMQLYERRLVLVRPDGHVAWRSDDVPANSPAIIDGIRGATAIDAG
ncbi:MAG TPA: FAD-dependent monooxygenase [Xanthobacteraceae bacterium]|jgi:2-polyprenyl-6-methoxyphenol hydroxylase-like FAD-dependent oxidoreductase